RARIIAERKCRSKGVLQKSPRTVRVRAGEVLIQPPGQQVRRHRWTREFLCRIYAVVKKRLSGCVLGPAPDRIVRETDAAECSELITGVPRIGGGTIIG